MENTSSVKIDFITGFKESLIASLLALVLMGPIVGMIIDGYDLEFKLMRPLTFAIIIFIVKYGYSILYQIPANKQFVDKYFKNKSHEILVAKTDLAQNKILVLSLIFIVGLIIPFFLSKYWITVLVQSLIYVLLGLGLNIVVGLAGLLDLGFVAFYAVGAYSLALFHEYLQLGFWSVLPLSAVIAFFTGTILGFPVLKTHGDYLAIVTLGFGEIIRLILNNWLEFTKGPNGMSAPKITFFGLPFKRKAGEGETTFFEFFGIDYNRVAETTFLYIILFLIVCFFIFFVWRLTKLPIGRAWEALREDEIACRSLGLSHVTIKLSAFAMGAMIGGIGGVFFGAYQGFVNPSSFTFIESALIVAIVVLGGLGSVKGVIIAAMAMNIIPELLREFSDYRVFIFGLVMVVMMLWKPRGLVKIVRPRYEKLGG